ncbi:sodium channel subunit beta-2-like isoform X4 [Simochromis diagramma]|uniref:sodium channel subunit beta-2-like isoform X4 n=1 Tax=Simochromis diagramma TaxID=43689 RepID=UPI001A7EC726|nr:sodium channel subunit beta-2-like isoform X4 [Simochromis diagramma]
MYKRHVKNETKSTSLSKQNNLHLTVRASSRLMSAKMSSVVVFFSLHVLLASGLKELRVGPGQDATLQCWGPRDAHVTLLEWSRPELISQGYVFFFQDQRSYENYQHESFKGRVQLRDSSMKDGDVSVILRNVRVSDTGTYECEITTSSIRNGERVVKEFKHSINLTVTDTEEDSKERGHKDGGDKDTSFPVILVLLCGLVVVVIATVAVNIYRKKKKSKCQHDGKCKHFKNVNVKLASKDTNRGAVGIRVRILYYFLRNLY